VTNKPRDIARDIRWGVGNGLFYALGFSGLVLVLALFRGSTEYPEYGTTTWRIIRVYFAAGVLGGLVLGWLRPVTSRRWGARAVGALIGTIVYGSAMLATDIPRSAGLVIALVLGIPMGALLGNKQWKESQPEDAVLPESSPPPQN
jgi:hypothetical protein